MTLRKRLRTRSRRGSIPIDDVSDFTHGSMLLPNMVSLKHFPTSSHAVHYKVKLLQFGQILIIALGHAHPTRLVCVHIKYGVLGLLHVVMNT